MTVRKGRTWHPGCCWASPAPDPPFTAGVREEELEVCRTFGARFSERIGFHGGMSTRFVHVDRHTPMLLPPDLRGWIPQDDLVHFVIRSCAGGAPSQPAGQSKGQRVGAVSAQDDADPDTFGAVRRANFDAMAEAFLQAFHLCSIGKANKMRADSGDVNADAIERLQKQGRDLYVAVSRDDGNTKRRYDYRPKSATDKPG